MNKQEFLAQLKNALSGLPQADIDEQINFYDEIINDRIEDGLTEDEAVLAVGQIDEIVSQVVAETPFLKIAKKRIKRNRRLKTWEIVLLALGSPIWLALGISVVAVILALYISLWAIIVSIWAVFVSVAACSVGSVCGGAIMIYQGNVSTGIAAIGAALVCVGLSIFVFYACKAATKGIVKLTKKLALGIKNCLIKKGEA